MAGCHWPRAVAVNLAAREAPASVVHADDGLILQPPTVGKLLSDLSYAVCNTVWVRYVSILLFSEKEENKSLCNQSRIIVDSINQVVRERGKRVSSISE